LLLAAFYFFGFAMGMFNNSTGDEAVETIASVTIPAETCKKAPEQPTFYYQINQVVIQNQTDTVLTKNTFYSFFPDTGTLNFYISDVKMKEFHFSGFRFSRPPPSAC
jgi:hypothetical protein